MLPWQTIGSRDCWQAAEKTALFYPHPLGPRPSVRLKAFTRGQQDVEYLTLLGSALGLPQWAVADWLRRTLVLEDTVAKASEEEAGTASFNEVTPKALWEMRYRVGRLLSEKSPPYRRALLERKNPGVRDGRLPEIGYVSTGPEVPALQPWCDSFR